MESFRKELLRLDEGLTSRIERYAGLSRITVNTMMQGVWSYLLHRYTGSNDIVYGVVVSGRPEDLPGMEHRVGMYINTVPLRSRWDGEKEIGKWLQEIQAGQLESRQYQYTKLSSIQEWTGITGDLFDSILAFENYPVSKVIGSTAVADYRR